MKESKLFFLEQRKSLLRREGCTLARMFAMRKIGNRRGDCVAKTFPISASIAVEGRILAVFSKFIEIAKV